MMKRTLVDLPQFGWQTSYYLRQIIQVIEASFKPIIVTLIEENFEDFIGSNFEYFEYDLWARSFLSLSLNAQKSLTGCFGMEKVSILQRSVDDRCYSNLILGS